MTVLMDAFCLFCVCVCVCVSVRDTTLSCVTKPCAKETRWIIIKSITKAYKAHEQTGDSWPAAQNNHIYYITEVDLQMSLNVILPFHMDIL